MITVGIVGGTGYVAGELLRCLIHHPEVHLDFVYSQSKSGEWVSTAHQDLFHATELVFTDSVNSQVDLVYLCLGHGNSKAFLSTHAFADHTRIIDLSNDFRLKEDATFEGKRFLYGLVELNREEIRQAQYIANPGCFATAIQLALLPLAKHQLLQDEVHIHALTGSTGAGKSQSETSHFSWRNDNVSIYKPFSHQHLGEITETITSNQPDFKKALNFLPLRGNFTRGIFTSAYTNISQSEDELFHLYDAYYKDAAFTQLSKDTIHLKQVVNSNYCLIQIQKTNGKVLVSCAIDNLLKGAAGQAIQSMNLMFGVEETTGLNLKTNYF
ncbi:MAG: N-acetyl-gamma-glutamyl-phosphate reductase [Flavobacteriales bacterium]|nr:N-acetyl-gamma-glutamyl-phosphate reductase [Flavobacteriales bacterium]